MAKSKKTDANEPDDPPMTGPTMAHATHDGEAPLLSGLEGDEVQTVTLDGGGRGVGTFRAALPLPIVLISGGSRYVLSDREAGTYHWEA
jgi:hypothetical protein